MLVKRLFSSTGVSQQTPKSVIAQSVAAAAARPTLPSFPVETGRKQQFKPGQRRFEPSQLIQPHELSQTSLFTEPRFSRPPLLGPKAREAKKIDPFHLSGTNALDMTYHPRLVAAFTNKLGRIRGRAETGLTWKSQRMVGKLIRRQRAMGLVPKWTNEAGKGGYGYVERSLY